MPTDVKAAGDVQVVANRDRSLDKETGMSEC